MGLVAGLIPFWRPIAANGKPAYLCRFFHEIIDPQPSNDNDETLPACRIYFCPDLICFCLELIPDFFYDAIFNKEIDRLSVKGRGGINNPCLLNEDGH